LISEISAKVKEEAVANEKFFKDNCIKGVLFVVLTWIAIKLGGKGEGVAKGAVPEKRWEGNNKVS